MFKNMKIAGKMVFGFALVLVITVVVGVFGIVNINTLNTNFYLLQNHPTERYKLLNNMAEDLVNMRRIVSVMAFRLGDEPALNSLLAEAQVSFNNIMTYLGDYQSNMQSDTQINPARAADLMAVSHVLHGLINDYYNNVVIGMFNVAREGIVGDPESRARVETFFDTGAALYAELYEQFEYLSEGAQITMDNRFAEINVQTANTTVMMVVLSAIAVVLGIAIAMIISRAIAKPISEVVDVIEDVAQGNLNVNIRANSKDETGMLAQSAQTLVSTLQKLIHDMEHMADEHERGDIDVVVPEDEFVGEFKTVASQINSMVNNHINTKKAAINAFSQLADGNFDFPFALLPGKKRFINDGLESMRTQIKAVASEINKIIKAAAVQGDLSIKIDESGYRDGWLEIMQGLNSVVSSVNDPIQEIRKVVGNLNAGKFDMQVEGDYPGDFLSIKNDVNMLVVDLNKYIVEIDQCLGAVASGDLTRSTSMQFDGDFDRIGQSINNIVDTLHKTMAEISAASSQVLSGASQISTSAMQLANGATEQASSVQELNASVDMISQQTNQNAESAEEANGLSNRSSENAREGNDAMKHMLEAMEQIKESSSNISKIIKTIQDIAFQTNLLSLNAAVEAARAGEHGKGFSVVAEEVRNLASRSQQAATETTQMIEDSINRVETGSGIAETTAESLDTIVSNASEIMQIIGSISVSSKDQAEAVGQVSIGLSQISQVVQSNSAVSEETAAAAEELNSQAELLQQLVSYFRL